MDIDNLGVILSQDNSILSQDVMEDGSGQYGTSENMTEGGWNIAEWRDTAEHWKWILEEDGWWKNTAEG